MGFQIGLETVDVLHGQGNDVSMIVRAEENDRACQVVLARQFDDLRRVVADVERSIFNDDQFITLP